MGGVFQRTSRFWSEVDLGLPMNLPHPIRVPQLHTGAPGSPKRTWDENDFFHMLSVVRGRGPGGILLLLALDRDAPHPLLHSWLAFPQQ